MCALFSPWEIGGRIVEDGMLMRGFGGVIG